MTGRHYLYYSIDTDIQNKSDELRVNCCCCRTLNALRVYFVVLIVHCWRVYYSVSDAPRHQGVISRVYWMTCCQWLQQTP